MGCLCHVFVFITHVFVTHAWKCGDCELKPPTAPPIVALACYVLGLRGAAISYRYFASKLWHGETFFMQIDAHSLFERSWDSLLIGDILK